MPIRPPGDRGRGCEFWKAEAPALDILAPDIYIDDYAKVQKVLDLYRRPDNALFVPEVSNAAVYAPYFFLALDHGTIGFSPFGIDYTRYANFPLGAKKMNEEALAPFAMNYELVAPMMRQLAQLEFDGKVHAVAEKKGAPLQAMESAPGSSTSATAFRCSASATTHRETPSRSAAPSSPSLAPTSSW